MSNHFRNQAGSGWRFGRVLSLAMAVMGVAGCATMTNVPTSGPTAHAIVRSVAAPGLAQFDVVDVTGDVAKQLLVNHQTQKFSQAFGGGQPVGAVVGSGDVLEISVWEAPPATLFAPASAVAGAGAASGLGVSSVTNLPDEMVGLDGTVTVPFAGQVPASGRTPSQIAAEITGRLRGMAHQPQVLVRLAHNATSNVTVVGEVGASLRMPLTAKGERVLDAIAAAGGVRQPIGKMTIQLTHDNVVSTMSMSDIVKDPAENVVLRPGDVVAALYQPFSFTVLGASGRNEEINYEGQGISLAQALGRVGGLQDFRADARGVFIFRYESPKVAAAVSNGSAPAAPNGRIPVVYRVDLKDPNSFFVVQNFQLNDKDILYVSNAPIYEVEKFLNVLAAIVVPASTVRSATY